jgi:N-acetylmuramic acid 6-phosphate etherase
MTPKKLYGKSEIKAREFLRVAANFRLGDLPTEQTHPASAGLSELARDDLPAALAVLKKIDLEALQTLAAKAVEIARLADCIQEALDSGGRIYICGCGATGRLALTLETLWRQQVAGTGYSERIISFMGGGDAALIRSLENFEDFPEYGARQLTDLGFAGNDLLIACTEGGETPFVIGAVQEGAKISSRKPYFLYCNPDDVLSNVAARFRRVLQNAGIRKLCLVTGPMALAGSTRMQASTVLMGAVGTSLFNFGNSNAEVKKTIRRFVSYWEALDVSFLESFVRSEANIYQKSDYIYYETESELGITVLTDTTERAPTFSLAPFENKSETGPRPSLCRLVLPDKSDSLSAWRALLGREPRALAWEGFGNVASLEYLLGFDFSIRIMSQRNRLTGEGRHYRFKISRDNANIRFELSGDSHAIGAPGLPPLFRHLCLKMLLNMQSTLVMGRLGRFTGNLMTWVRPSCNKLVDRAVRYADLLLRERGKAVSYEKIVFKCFEVMRGLPHDGSLVMALVDDLLEDGE